MPLSINCPHCKATLEANVRIGQVISCPACSEQFEVERRVVKTEDKSLSNSKYIVPLGYAAFVGVPILITIAVVFSLSGSKKDNQVAEEPSQVAKNDPKSTSSSSKKISKHGPPNPRQPSDKFTAPDDNTMPPNEDTGKPGPSTKTPDNSAKTEPKPTT